MAVIPAQTVHFLRPLSLSSPSSPRFPSQSPAIPLLHSHAPSITTVRFSKSTNEISCSSPSRLVARASPAEFSANTSDILGDVNIFTAAGESVFFKDLWDQNEGMAVVALLRHFGCPCCWELASVLKESKAKFDSAGVKLIAVGVGTPNKAQSPCRAVTISNGLPLC
ncbi:hypothetical protein L1049_024447 [Liquidambar formosana]|uniref:Uncharacterized protein n=1 Tax=Liquidambar formosana TaxID=63359 RepID=A0AAP0S0Z1_LIQFO